MPDAIVVGAGPNGLAAAITLARAGRSVVVYEAASEVGGGSRSAELTLPGFSHDVCSAAHPLAIASPFFRSLDLARHGLEWIQPDAPLGHALSPTRAVILERSVAATAAGLGRDGPSWRRLFEPLVAEWERLVPALLGPPVRPPWPPLLLARFGLPALAPVTTLARIAFREPPAGALLSGLAAHSMIDLRQPLSASYGIALGLLAHGVGWPFARGGSGRLAAALEHEARGLGVEIVTDHEVAALDALPPARAIVLDLTPRQVLAVAASRLPARTRRRLESFRYGPGVFKIDWALDGPIPWSAPELGRAGTVHLGGPMADVVRSESAMTRGGTAGRPFVLVTQPTLFDSSRAPAGKHVAWAYCHVPHGSGVDMTSAIEAQLERFAPGFRDLVLARSTHDAGAMEAYDRNYVGGDINGGSGDWRQLLFRPWPAIDPYRLVRGVTMCSSSTPPGAGVHGMCGWHAARSALRHDLAG